MPNPNPDPNLNPHQVNSLEMEMLRMISFSLFVQSDQYERYISPISPLRLPCISLCVQSDQYERHAAACPA